MSTGDSRSANLQSAEAKRKVLVIDDDRDFAEGMADALVILGYQVDIATSFDEALVASERVSPDGVLLDLRLGQSNGLDLLPALRKNLPNLICVIVTAFPDIQTAIGAVRHRANDYLRKPVSPEDVGWVLNRCFARIATGHQSAVEENRENAFGRLLVRRIDNLLNETEQGPDTQQVFSRNIIPGFFVAVDMMLGPERVQNFQRRCGDLIDRLGGGNESQNFWDKFCDDPEARSIVVEAEANMAVHFISPDRRLTWFANLINTHVGPGHFSRSKSKGEMSVNDAAILLVYLFSDLEQTLSTENGRKEIGMTSGQQSCDLLVTVLKELKRISTQQERTMCHR
ncbi:MAG: response regulator [Alphaproteobacteria bacterium]|nr:response regulator [Alphaproteobacteria bacterium]MBL6945999.1 response regulator [Rhodospirillales bacterium]